MLDDWLADLLAQVDLAAPLLPVVEEFRQVILRDPEIYMLFTAMLVQVPYDKDPTGQPQVRTIDAMLALFNHVMTHAPGYNDTGLVGFPINAILDWAMGTPAGYAAFLNDQANEQFAKMLDEWATFLRSADSTAVLNSSATGWLGPAALKKLGDVAKTYVCDPSAPHWGFTSWDDFFTRQFRPGVRPIASPTDAGVLVNACESAPYRVASNVAEREQFWLKGQPYSLAHMLAEDPLTPQFVGGTVYQAFLSALSYHRWHSPVDGVIVKTQVVPGTYYSETPAEGYDPSGPNDSQAYITEVATRALIFIEADNPAIGLMCFMPVGMAEVSTCDITVYEGQRVRKGDQLGMFHFGGSTHCLIFRPGVRLQFDLHGQVPGLNSSNIPINSRIATVTGGDS
ncbi:phosphatidylserine decarboxylase family protein [Cellulomonas sp. Leaf334]|uniref:phosphatidylserine decarboxylase family protein n=1 Tax=Cellulomonas sp. Leaf334 TaxID=1736339 RepID=UPI0019108D47|nr:phosphatidylserine decarboxylase family protein [Cellulomonas sp. Leaf334]